MSAAELLEQAEAEGVLLVLDDGRELAATLVVAKSAPGR